MSGRKEFAAGLETDVRAELRLAESGDVPAEEGEPPTEWAYDPVDAERYEVGLENVLGAAEALDDEG